MSNKITIKEMSEYCADNCELTTDQCKRVIELYMEGVERTLETGLRVHMTGFGMFEARKYHYPAEGVNAKDVDKWQVLFHASDKLEKRLNAIKNEAEADFEQPFDLDSDPGE